MGLDVANLIIFVSINGGKIPYKSNFFQTNFTFWNIIPQVAKFRHRKKTLTSRVPKNSNFLYDLSPNLARSSCGWWPVHGPHKIEKKHLWSSRVCRVETSVSFCEFFTPKKKKSAVLFIQSFPFWENDPKSPYFEEKSLNLPYLGYRFQKLAKPRQESSSFFSLSSLTCSQIWLSLLNRI